MIFKVIFLIFYSLFIVAGINLTYIVKKDENVIYPSCIAEELERYAAIGWIYPIPETVQNLPNISTKFLPTIDNDYNCEFSKNSLCNIRWSLKDWRIDEKNAKTRDSLFDYRWEGLSTIYISKTTEEFSKNFELGDIPKVAFSIRAQGVVELFFCSGWNPYNYPCYYFYVNNRNIYFKVYQTVPQNISDGYKKDVLREYGAFSDILSYSEWRTFVFSFHSDGLVKLTDLNLDRTLIEYSVKEKINPLYMFVRSANASLWKFHENHFFQTTTPQISRLGPQLVVSSKDLCISLLVNMCENCEMTFFYMNGTDRKILKTLVPIEIKDWFEIKLKEENIQADRINIFVETKFTNSFDGESGFWGIDNVRVCNENEVKVSHLKLKTMPKSDNEVSCQVVKNKNWRPKPHIYKKIQDFPQVESVSGTNSIKMMWTEEDHSSEITYFVSYKANDLCTTEPYNPKRMKSSGFLSTKMNQVLLENLVPFTLYNVTVSSVLHENDKKLLLHTLETDELYPEELPYKVQVRPLDTSVRVSWQPVNCSQRYGRIVYTVIVSNKNLNFSTSLSLQTDTSYEIPGLQPFTQYVLTIITARNGRNIYQRKFTRTYKFNFTTSAGVAPPVENLELYSIDKSSASLRFELPVNPHGITREVQVNKCNALSFKKCKSTILPLRECPFWPGKYCVDVQYLIPYQRYTFRVSLKNINTHTFGKEMSVDGYTNDQVPGAPTNVTYRTVDCDKNADVCHLNVTWLHPYHQNGTITAFNILLNRTDGQGETRDAKYIQEMYKIENNTYYSYYTYQIKFVPYSTSYELYIQSENLAYKSEFTHTTVKTDDIGDHIDQSPKLISNSHSGLTFQLPGLDKRLNYYETTVVVQDYNTSVKVDDNIMKNKKISDHLCHQYGNSWISQTRRVNTSEDLNIIIGNAEKERLIPGEKYCIVFVINNNYKGSEHDAVYYQKVRLLDETPVPKEDSIDNSGSGFNPLYLLFLLLLLVPIGYFVYRYMQKNKRKPKRTVDTKENIYESLPFEECESTSVDNVNYDKLLHQ